MASTSFVDYSTPIVAAWLNDVNTLVYTTYPAYVISNDAAVAAKASLISPSFTTPTLGVAVATSINKNTFTAPATTNTWTLANNKTFTVSNTLTLTGTDSSSVAFGTGGTVVYTANTLAALASTTSAQFAGVISDATGTGKVVFGTDPTFTLTDVTTNNVSATAHGWAPKFPNNTTTFLRGDGTYASPISILTGATATNPTSSTITLTSSSNQLQVAYPNTSGLAFKLPDATTMAILGFSFILKNRTVAGSYPMQILDNGSNLIGWVLPGAVVYAELESSGSANGTWVISTGTVNSDNGFYDWGCSATYSTGSASNYTASDILGVCTQMLDSELGLLIIGAGGASIQPKAFRVTDGGIKTGASGTTISPVSGISLCQNGAAEVVCLSSENPIKAISYIINTSTLALTSQTAVTKAAVATAVTSLDWQANSNIFYAYTETTTNKAWCGSLTGSGAGLTFNAAVQLSATAAMKSAKIAALTSTLSHQLAWDGSTIYINRSTWSGTTPTPGAQTTVASRGWTAGYVNAMEIVKTSATVSLAVYGGLDSNSNNSNASIYANVITDTGSAITTSETRLVDGFSAAFSQSSKMQFISAQKGVNGSINIFCSDGSVLKQATVRLVSGVPVLSAFVTKSLPGPIITIGTTGHNGIVPNSVKGVSGVYLLPTPVFTGAGVVMGNFTTAAVHDGSIVFQPQCIAPQ